MTAQWTDGEWQQLGAPAVERGKREILADIDSGIVPAGVRSFAVLHDYVDANEYGGACECDPDTGEFTAFWSRVQDELDQWLRAGRPVT